jgi:HPt (histidine-containing phosphotransfer) domain-containing protein
MSRVRAFFLEEAAECLDILRKAGGGPPDHGKLLAAARRLRGHARLARYGRLADAAERLEDTLKRLVRGEVTWTEGTGRDVANAIRELERSVHSVREGSLEPDIGGDMTTDRQLPASTEEVPIEDMEYSGVDALHRALELRTALEDGIVSGAPVGPVLDELFDLIRLAIE